MRVLQLKATKKSDPNTQIEISEDILKEEVSKLAADLSTEEKKKVFEEELTQFFAKIRFLLEEDSKICSLENVNDEVNKNLLDEYLPHDKVFSDFDSLFSQLVMKNPDVPDEMKVRLALNLDLK